MSSPWELPCLLLLNSCQAPAHATLLAAGNTVRQNLLGTGAFEVSYDGTPIFSKLDTGRMPTLPELVAGIAEAMAAAGNPAGSGTEQ